jgi:hypothetical protein
MMYLERDENGEIVVRDEKELEKAASNSRAESQKKHDREMELYQKQVNLHEKKIMLILALAVASAALNIVDAGYEDDRETALADPAFHRQVCSWLEAQKTEAQKPLAAATDAREVGVGVQMTSAGGCSVTDYGKREAKQ